MCEYCENLDVTGRGKNLAIRKDDIYRDFIQLVKFPKAPMRKQEFCAVVAYIQGVNMYAEIHFCPMCGRKLMENNAVEPCDTLQDVIDREG